MQDTTTAFTAENKPSWQFNHSYTNLPPLLFTRVLPTPVKAPKPVLINYALAEALGLPVHADNLALVTAQLSGNALPPGADPLAQAYIGHQFGYPNMLGDGRAILLGEHITPAGASADIQLKGAGATQYSRRGDGRATLSSMLREYIISEAMYHLGIPTTRSLAVVATGEQVYRETVQDGAVLTRIAASHIRVGTFEFATRHLSVEDFRRFTHYVIERHYPELKDAEIPALALLNAVINRQADLITHWMRVGFIHGVMNTDNMSIAGETIDYGPCAFMNRYDPATVFSSIDTEGRYAYANQPAIAQWNLAVFASSLLPLIDENTEKAVELAKASVQRFPGLYAQKWLRMMRKKLGLITELPGDKKLIEELLLWMQTNEVDYTNTFFDLSSGTLPSQSQYREDAFKIWHAQWIDRLADNEQPIEAAYTLMKANNPAFIPRNHLMEEALAAATLGNNISLVEKLIDVLSKPYMYKEKNAAYQELPLNDEGIYKTFCGT